MTEAFIGIGSNFGDRLYHVHWAIEELRRLGELRVSSLYETDPVGTISDLNFVNAVARLETLLGPRELLGVLQGIEKKLGRVQRERWGPREIDLDLLLYGDAVIFEPDLKVPHPEMTSRAFVLVPLLEIEPDARMPDGQALSGALQDLGTSGVRIFSGMA